MDRCWVQQLVVKPIFKFSSLMLQNVLLITTLWYSSSGVAQQAADTETASAWNLFSRSQDISLGEDMSLWIDERSQLSEDPALVDLLDRMLQRFADSNQLEYFPYEIRPIDSLDVYSQPNPGGPVYITTGLVAAMNSESQLAGIVSHQLAHISLRHTTRELSAAKRFKVRAALVAASTGMKSLMQSLAEAGLYLEPGAPFMYFSLEAEQEADRLAAKLLSHAGYESTSALNAFKYLHDHSPGLSGEFLQRHPRPVEPGQSGKRPAKWASEKTLIPKRKFKQLKRDLVSTGSAPGLLDELLAWTPPPQSNEAVRTRELFITRSYQFSYPLNWVPVKPGINESIMVAPKTGWLRKSGKTADFSVGVMAAAIDLDEHGATPLDTLLQHINEIRKGLKPASDQRDVKQVDGGTHGILLEGESPVPGQRELVWAVTTRIQDTWFYLLMVAPEREYANYLPEFRAIFESITFDGPPQYGRTEAPHGGSAKLRPQTQWRGNR